MTKPVFNRDGTPNKELFEQNNVARLAVVTAIKALENAAPQMRDYFLKGTHFFDAAMREHKDRLERLQSVRDEIKLLLDHISQSEKAQPK